MWRKGFAIWLTMLVLYIVMNVSPSEAADSFKLQTASINDGAVTLIPPFNPNNTSYKAIVDDNVESITFKAAASSGTVLVNNSGIGPNGTKIALSYGQNVITAVVSGGSGDSTSTSYRFTVERTSSKLKSLKFSTGSLGPAFQRDTLSYTLNFAGFTNTIDITAVMEDPNASMKFDSVSVVSGVPFRPLRNLAVGDNSFSLVIVSQTGESSTYTINLRRSSQSVPYSSAQSGSSVNVGGNGSGNGSGSGGTIGADETAAPLFPKTQLTDQHGRTTMSVVANYDQLAKVLKDSTGKSAIDASSSSPVDKIDISLPEDSMKLLMGSGRSVVLDTSSVTLALKANALVRDGSTDATESKLTVTAANPANPAFASKPNTADKVVAAFDLSASVGGSSLAAFAGPVTISVKLDPSKYRDSDKLGVYAFDNAQQTWIYAGGSVKPGSVIVYETDRIGTFAVMETAITFKDTVGHWASRAIERMTAMRIVSGVTSDLFSPEEPVSRAEFASLLTRTLKLPAAGHAVLTFTDIPADAWYKSELTNAYKSGLVDGLSPTAFGPNDPISREQMAAMLIRAYSYAINVRVEDMVVGRNIGFADEDNISSWAVRSVRLAESVQLMDGSQDDSFHPKAQTTRAEAVAALSRLLDRIDH